MFLAYRDLVGITSVPVDWDEYAVNRYCAALARIKKALVLVVG